MKERRCDNCRSLDVLFERVRRIELVLVAFIVTNGPQALAYYAKFFA